MANNNVLDLFVNINGNAAGANRATDSARAGVDGLAKSILGAVAAFAGLATAIAGLNKVVEVSREFAILNSQLETATGSAENAGEAFKAIQRFAATTPYDLKQAVEGFTKLVNLGLTPSEQALRSYGNTASSMGKDLSQMIEAVADASTGEFERLKEFGIKSSKEGDKVVFTFRGIKTEVANSAAEIEKFLIQLGENEFGGAMDKISQSIEGAFSNFGDGWDGFFRVVGAKGISKIVGEDIAKAAGSIADLNNTLEVTTEESLKNVQELWDYIGLGHTVENSTNAAKNAILEFDAMLGSGWAKTRLEAIAVDFSLMENDVAHTFELMRLAFGSELDLMRNDSKGFFSWVAEQVALIPINIRTIVANEATSLAADFQEFKTVASSIGESMSVVGKNFFSSNSNAEIAQKSSAAIQQILKKANDDLLTIDQNRLDSMSQTMAERQTTLDAINKKNTEAEQQKTAYIQRQNQLLAEQKKLSSSGDALARFKIGGSAAGAEDAAKKAAAAVVNPIDKALQEAAKRFGYSFEAVNAAFKRNAAKYGVDEYILKAQAQQESQFNPKARSPVGALGFSQFMPATATRFGLKDRTDPIDSIRAQAEYMGKMLQMFNGKIELALAGYNAGENRQSLRNGRIPAIPETQNYVKKILSEYEKVGPVSGLVEQFDSEQKLLKNQLEAYFATSKNAIESKLKQAEFESNSTIESLKQLKEAGKIGINEYYDGIAAEQIKIIQAQIEAAQSKLALALEQFTTDKLQSAPEDLPKLKASFEIEQGSLESELQRLKDELAKVGINATSEKDKAGADARQNLLQTRASLLAGTQAGEDAQEALQLDEIARAYNAAAISLTEFEQRLNDVKNQHDETFQSMVQMGEGAAGALEQAFAQILFDPLNANFREIALNFVNMLRKMLAEAIAKAAIKAILNAISGATGGWGGIISGVAGAATGGGGGVGGYHSGGIVGSPKMHFAVNPLAFASAPRYHSGGIAGLKADEVPAVLRRDEEVLTRNDPRHRYNGSGSAGGSQSGGGNVTSIVVMDPAFVPDAMAGQMGSKVVINHIRDNASSIKRMLDGA